MPASATRSASHGRQTGKRQPSRQPSAQGKNPKRATPRKKQGRRIPVFKIVLAVLALLVILFLGDLIKNYGKVYNGVNVGGVELGGMTVEEAQSALDSAFADKVVNSNIALYSKKDMTTNEEAMQLKAEVDASDDPENTVSGVIFWHVSGTELDVSFPGEAIAQEAVDYGKGFTGIFKRLGVLLFGKTLDPYAMFNEPALEQLANRIDTEVGNPRVDFSVEIKGGEASVISGHDGYEVNRMNLRSQINHSIFDGEEGGTPQVVYAEYAPLRITEEIAKQSADRVNNAIGDGLIFIYQDLAWIVTPTTVGSWVTVSFSDDDGYYSLKPELNESLVKANLLSYIRENSGLNSLKVTFDASGDTISVSTDADGVMPKVNDALTNIQSALFGEKPHAGAAAIDSLAVEVDIESTAIPASMDLQTALDSGIVSEFSSYTTEYSVGSKTTERNYNIHLMSDLLNNSICKANGGEWSMNETSGESNEANGFKAAGSILEGEVVDSIGGGICQVATTVFNAVYEAGLPITQRSNHTLYMASYPDGRDAAVSWPELDLKFVNNTASDILVCLSYTESTVTCKLLGVNPGYRVETTTGPWQEGEKYTTRYIINTYHKGSWTRVNTAGQNARTIVVNRKVFDSAGKQIREDNFTSKYKVRTEIIEIAPGEQAEKYRAQGLVLKTIDQE